MSSFTIHRGCGCICGRSSKHATGLAAVYRAQRLTSTAKHTSNNKTAAACRPRTSIRRSVFKAQAMYAQTHGPYKPTQLQTYTLKLGISLQSDQPLSCKLMLTVPTGVFKAPLVVLSAGFLIDSSQYRTYADFLASHGYVVALYDMSELCDDLQTVKGIRAIINTMTGNDRLRQYVDPDCVILAGHSRGGKLSCLTASMDERIKGLLLIDPVDNTAMTPSGPSYPTSLPGLRRVNSRATPVPVLVVGAGLNGDVIPAEGNHRRFVESCPGPCWWVELRSAGHLQFLDKNDGLLSLFSQGGPMLDETVRTATQAAMLCFLEEIIKPYARKLPMPQPSQLTSKLQDQAKQLSRMADIDSRITGLDILSTSAASATTSASTASTSSRTASNSRAPPPPPPPPTNSSQTSSSNSTSSSWQGSYSGTGSWEGSFQAASDGTAGSTSAQTSSTSSSYTASTASSSGRSQANANAHAPGNSNHASSSSVAAEVSAEVMQSLLKKRAKELKQVLVDNNVDCSDCFEKEDLAKRIVEKNLAGRFLAGNY